MLNAMQMLDLYKAEKSQLGADYNSEFPSFVDWKSGFQLEHEQIHRDSRLVTVDEADKYFDNVLAEIDSEVVDSTTTIVKEIHMTTETTETTAVATTKPKRVRKPVVAKAKSKMDQARSIFKSLSRGKNGPDRAKIIAKFVSDVKLSAKGASTYYQTLKNEGKKAA